MRERAQKVSSQKMQKMIIVCFLLFVIVYPLVHFFPLEVDRQNAFQGFLLMIIEFFALICLYIEFVNKRIVKEVWKKIVFGSIFFLAFCGFISVLFSSNKEIALYGTLVRGEGFFSLLSYYCIFLLASLLNDITKRKKLIYAFWGSGVVISFIGILQFFDVLTYEWGNTGVARVPMVNQNFFASYAILLAGSMMIQIVVVNEKSHLSKIIYLLMLSEFFLVGLCCMSSVIYVGMIMCFFMLYCINFIGKKKKALLITELLGLYILIIIVLNFVSDYRISGEAASVVNQIAAEESIFGDSVGSGRMRAWKQIISLLPEYGVFGCGIEQLGSLYIERFGYLEGGIYFDRAHNEYLHIWITQGLFALISYLVFLFAIYIPGHLQFSTKGKYVSDDVSKIAFLAFFGYIAQAFFNISVIQVAPYFWMLCGLIVGGIQKKEEGTGQELKMVTVNKSEKGIGEKPESKSLLRN